MNAPGNRTSNSPKRGGRKSTKAAAGPSSPSVQTRSASAKASLPSVLTRGAARAIEKHVAARKRARLDF